MTYSRYNEQRDFRRMTVDAPTKVVFVKDDTMVQVDAICKDLSATGLSLQVPQALLVGDLIEVIIHGQNVAPLDIKAKVRRVQALDDGNYLLGCETTSVR